MIKTPVANVFFFKLIWIEKSKKLSESLFVEF